MAHRSVRRLAGLMTLLLAAPTVAQGAALGVSPTRLDLPADRPSGIVTLRNESAEPVLVQVETFTWHGSDPTVDVTPTRELVAVPPMLELPPGDTRIIRIARRDAHDGPVELAYRLHITEVPQPGPRPGMGVRFALRLSLPVFVSPAESRAAPTFRLAQGARDGLELRVANRGSAHLHLRRLTVGDGPSASPVLEAPAYLLPGQERSWAVRRAAAATTQRVRAETNLGELELVVPVEGR